MTTSVASNTSTNDVDLSEINQNQNVYIVLHVPPMYVHYAPGGKIEMRSEKHGAFQFTQENAEKYIQHIDSKMQWGTQSVHPSLVKETSDFEFEQLIQSYTADQLKCLETI